MELKIKITRIKSIEFEGKKFNTYAALQKDGKLIDVKFVQGCKNVPTQPSTITVDNSMCNIDRRRQYPCLWVKDVISVEPLVFTPKEDLSELF